MAKVDRFTKPKGLDNIGATCYMNAVLQCFFHVEVLTNELLQYQIIPCMPFTIAYKDIISQLASNNISSGNPTLFKNVISMNPLFRGIQANDSKDLILYFMENIENELTIKNLFCCNQRYINRIKNIRNVQTPELLNIINVFQNNHKSIISDLFYGFKSQLLECDFCHNKQINYQIFNILIFPIEAIYNLSKESKGYENNYGKKNLNRSARTETQNQVYGSFYNGYSKTSIYGSYNGGYGKKSVSIESCFEFENNDIKFHGDNQIYCNKCQKMRDAVEKTKIFSSPHVLILVLNRGRGNSFDCDVDFKETLNISKYVENKDVPVNYQLIGVISHLGESSMSGHFIADCRHFDGKWYSFSDRSVTGPNGYYSKKGTPYILFYQNKELLN